jgi:hypothetical protein
MQRVTNAVTPCRISLAASLAKLSTWISSERSRYKRMSGLKATKDDQAVRYDLADTA